MTPFRSDRERRGAFAKKGGGGHRAPPNPAGVKRVKSPLARELMLHDSIFLWDNLQVFPSGLDAIGDAMEYAFLAPRDAAELRQVVADILGPDEGAALEGAGLLAWVKHLRANVQRVEDALPAVLAGQRLTAANVDGVVRRIYRARGRERPAGAEVANLRRYLEQHHLKGGKA